MRYKTFNNSLVGEIVYLALHGNYDLAVIKLFSNLDELTDALFVRLYSFLWYQCNLKEYYDVLRRLRKTSVEWDQLHVINKLNQIYKKRGGVLK